ncbi:MAG: hypothetical protein IJX05_01375 [Clostridia bacterium]|nr:hypothetical protein [Clostridia bacterium]
MSEVCDRERRRVVVKATTVEPRTAESGGQSDTLVKEGREYFYNGQQSSEVYQNSTRARA